MLRKCLIQTLSTGVVLIALGTFFGCGEKSSSGFAVQIESSVTVTNAPVEIKFSALTQAPVGEALSYAWEFGDGTASEEESPQHRYENPGVFEVSVVVTAAGGSSGTSMSPYSES